jgi:hypothetical protein
MRSQTETEEISSRYVFGLLITVATRPKARTTFIRSNNGVMGSNPIRAWLSVCVLLFCLCCSVCRQRPCEVLIPRPRTPTNYV